ncbi:hypothetical protein ART_0763 [Arthrobacter sp. PAMC 25486]|uniref:hypothetical protein n=1 Tax=Arthrobacter sp. PAMC 25486 TaxID=1494608 RepID=UPI000535D69B|nr:hypothetical protein [Arthrobacter sp. PAMC 25486]AIY00362.1 hypothetical protein ART_0763 [Arthrobacter sp. PAMC 25486]
MSSNTPENPSGQQLPPSYGASAPTDLPAPYGQQPPAYEAQAPAGPPAPYGQQPAPYGQQSPYGAPAVDPGKTLGILSVILPFVGLGLVGLILGIIGKVKSKKAGFKNTPALVGIIIGIVAIIATIIAVIIAIVFFVDVANQVAEGCQNGAETVTINGEVFSCSTVSP